MTARTLVISVAILISGNAHASGVLRASLLPPAIDSNTVTLQLENTGDDDINIVSNTLPQTTKKGVLTNSALLHAVDSGGRDAEYQGIFIEYDLSAPEEFVTLAPGTSRTFKVDLGKSYALTAGESYKVSALLQPKYLDRALSKYPSRSNEALRPLYRTAQLYPIVFTPRRVP